MKYQKHISRKGAKTQSFFFDFPLRLCAFAGVLLLTALFLSGCAGTSAAEVKTIVHSTRLRGRACSEPQKIFR
jgi:hypothetical protein